MASAAAAPSSPPSRGQIVFLQCRACHSLKAGEPHSVGPNLEGLFGATAGKKEGYVFSEVLASSSLVWTAETLDAWLKDPGGFLPENKMAYVGVPSETDRQAVIEFLEAETR